MPAEGERWVQVRRTPLLGFLVVLLAGLLVLVTVMASPALARAGRGAGEDRIAEAIVSGINAERQARGLAPMQWSSDSYAQQRAEDQPKESTDGHAGFSSKAAAGALGLSGSYMTAEALYWGPIHGGGDAVRGWMNSNAHRDLLMHAEMTLLAVGVRCRDGALHAVAHVGSKTARDIPSTPAKPVVTSSAGPYCKESAPAPEPEPEPEPAPEPDPEPAPESAPEPASAPAPPEPTAPAPGPTEQVDEAADIEQSDDGPARVEPADASQVLPAPPIPPPANQLLAGALPEIPRAPSSLPVAPVAAAVGLVALLVGMAGWRRAWVD